MSTTADAELAFRGPGALADLVRSRQVHPRELVELCLRRIEALDPALNAFRVTMAEQALAEADGLVPEGPLAGVPVAIKDDLAVAGQVATRGSKTYGPPAGSDSEVVRRLRAAGAIPIGITNVPEQLIFPWTASDANGVTRNPWDVTRTPGGSSGGSAAAVAAGMVPIATGSDGGGSIRIPAACCGLVGMKPSRGRVSNQPARPGWLGLSVYGGLARTVSDSALLLDVVHGATEHDTDPAPPFTGSYLESSRQPPARLRVAMSRKIPPGLLAKVAEEPRRAWEQTGELLAELGHEVLERDPAYRMSALEFTQLWIRGIYEDVREVPEPEMLERSTRQMAAAGRALVPPRRRERLLVKREATAARIDALWDEVDVLLTPALSRTPIAAEAAYGRSAFVAFDRAGRFTPFTPPFNLTGQPAMTLPAGFSGDGLPLSVQLVGRRGGEDTLYSLAGQLEEARPWAQHRPGVS
jgi:amidase